MHSDNSSLKCNYLLDKIIKDKKKTNKANNSRKNNKIIIKIGRDKGKGPGQWNETLGHADNRESSII